MGKNLSVATRRRKARGFNARHLKFLSGRKFLGLGNRAQLITTRVHLISERPGIVGNSVTLTLVAAGNNTPLSVSVAGNALTVNLATNGSAASISTSKEVVDAINNNGQTLVWAQLPFGGLPTAVVTAAGATALSGAVA